MAYWAEDIWSQLYLPRAFLSKEGKIKYEEGSKTRRVLQVR